MEVGCWTAAVEVSGLIVMIWFSPARWMPTGAARTNAPGSAGGNQCDGSAAPRDEGGRPNRLRRFSAV
jgi:hypothetical protein